MGYLYVVYLMLPYGYLNMDYTRLPMAKVIMGYLFVVYLMLPYGYLIMDYTRLPKARLSWVTYVGVILGHHVDGNLLGVIICLPWVIIYQDYQGSSRVTICYPGLPIW